MFWTVQHGSRTAVRRWLTVLSMLALGTMLLAGLAGGSVAARPHSGPVTDPAAPVPLVTVTASPTSTVSGATSLVHVAVSISGAPQAGATIKLASSAGGTFSGPVPVTGVEGSSNSTFTAPKVTSTTSIEITATATIAGQPKENGYANISVQPSGSYLVVRATLPQGANVHVNSSLLIEFAVQNNTGAAVKGATVMFTSTVGSFAPTGATTGTSGDVVVALTVPASATAGAAFVIATASAGGYVTASDQQMFTVQAGGVTPLWVSVSVNQTNLKPGVSTNVSVTVTVHAGNVTGILVRGATVALILTDGTATPGSQKSNATGVAVFVVNAPATLSAGTVITLTASASSNAYGGGYSSAQMNVGSSATTGGPPPFLSSNSDWLWISLGVVAVVVVLAFVVVVLRRRKPPAMVMKYAPETTSPAAQGNPPTTGTAGSGAPPPNANP